MKYLNNYLQNNSVSRAFSHAHHGSRRNNGKPRIFNIESKGYTSDQALRSLTTTLLDEQNFHGRKHWKKIQKDLDKQTENPSIKRAIKKNLKKREKMCGLRFAKERIALVEFKQKFVQEGHDMESKGSDMDMESKGSDMDMESKGSDMDMESEGSDMDMEYEGDETEH